MGLLAILKARMQAKTRLVEQAEGVADCCLEAVWQRVEAGIVGLPAAEARGYAWAHAGAIVRSTSAAAFEGPDGEQLYRLALAATVRRVTGRAWAVASARKTRRLAA